MRQFSWKSGEPYVWLCGGAIALSVIMVAAMLLLLTINGLGFFWPRDIARLILKDGRVVIGEIVAREEVPDEKAGTSEAVHRIEVKRGNRDVYGADFEWFDEEEIVKQDFPGDVVLIERLEWGNFYGFLKQLESEAGLLSSSSEEAIRHGLDLELDKALATRDEVAILERDKLGAVNYRKEQNRLELKKLELAGITDGIRYDELRRESSQLLEQYNLLEEELVRLRAQGGEVAVVAATGDGVSVTIPLTQVVSIIRPNEMGTLNKLYRYFHKVWEFISSDPRESNTEGGVFPAIFGTVMLVLIMSVVVTPFGVLAAIYLREYAKQGKFVSLVRIAVNNLAGVPSIVYGVFGVGFFIYTIGGSIDQLFYAEALPTPTWGTGGILWASLTLALLTVPTVIVATEEGLASIPRSLREGSYALGSTRFETTWRVVLPCLVPSILTGLILAVARAAGEVAPLMVTGVVKLAPALPVDGYAPFLHLERKFMHLGFHIYDVGFQSPNVDAARPMVYTTAFLLLVIVVALNLVALVMRNRLRHRFMISGV